MNMAQQSSNTAETQQKLSDLYIAYLSQLSSTWSSYTAARMLKPDLVGYMVSRFHRCSTPIKVRILMSFLYISPQLREDCRSVLTNFLSDCETETDDWVRKLSRLLQPYIETGNSLKARNLILRITSYSLRQAILIFVKSILKWRIA